MDDVSCINAVKGGGAAMMKKIVAAGDKGELFRGIKGGFKGDEREK
jgi:hypothetical protein